MSKAKLLKIEMNKRRKAKSSLKDISLLLKCKESGNFLPMLNTILYNKYSGEYCEYLSLINN
jgi:hypothetical protein